LMNPIVTVWNNGHHRPYWAIKARIRRSRGIRSNSVAPVR
jgi:hypothetical protein